MELGPFWGGDLGASWSTKHSFPIGDRQLPETPVSASPRLVKSAFLVPGASVPLFKQRFPLPLCPFPSPFPFPSPAISHSSVCPLVSLSCPSKRVGIRQRQHHSSHPVVMSLWLATPHLHRWQAVVRQACLRGAVQTVVQQALPDWRFMRVTEVQISYHVGWKCDHPNLLTFMFLPPRELLLGTSWSGRFLYTGVPAGESATCGCCPTDDVWLTGFQAWSPWLAVDRMLPSSRVLSGSKQLGARIHTRRRWVQSAISLFLSLSLSLSVCSVPPPLVLTPTLQSPLSWKLHVCP